MAVLEAVAAVLGLGEGEQRLEVVYRDGRVERAHAHADRRLAWGRLAAYSVGSDEFESSAARLEARQA